MVTYRCGPFRLVPDQRRLERDGTALALTPKAFDLLVALVRHHTRALSKDEILALVWNGSAVEEGNLAQQVLVLRRALAEAGECVATVPRHGYRFVAAVSEEPPAALIESKFWLKAHGWTQDGARLLYHLTFGDQQTASGLWMLTMPGSVSTPFRNDSFRYPHAALSPDGHWVAYSSNQSGRFEIYVESVPTPGRRVQVSADGGTQPRWRRDQQELYFLAADSHLIAVPVTLGAEATLGVATPLFTVAMPGGAMSGGPLPGGVGTVSATQYDVSADGRFLAAVVERHVSDRPPVTVALNATAGLKPRTGR